MGNGERRREEGQISHESKRLTRWAETMLQTATEYSNQNVLFARRNTYVFRAAYGVQSVDDSKSLVLALAPCISYNASWYGVSMGLYGVLSRISQQIQVVPTPAIIPPYPNPSLFPSRLARGGGCQTRFEALDRRKASVTCVHFNHTYHLGYLMLVVGVSLVMDIRIMMNRRLFPLPPPLPPFETAHPFS